jgi:hypothetical protein
MDFFSNLNQTQIASLILLGVSTPLLIVNIRYWVLADQSRGWPKVKGAVMEGFDFSISGALTFSYQYSVNGRLYSSKRPFFANSYKKLGREKTDELISKYSLGQEIDVYYNPSKPEMSVLEPGRKDGLLSAIILLAIFFLAGVITFYNGTVVGNLLQ